MIVLSDADRKLVEGIIKTHANDQHYHVYVFGSRATGRAQKYSDVDIALMGEAPIPPKVISTLAEAFEESSIPYFVDIVDCAKASDKLLDQILNEGELLIQV